MLNSLNVLMLEDREEDARLLLRELNQAGFEVTWSRVDGETGYMAALNPSLDVILADYHLPGWDVMEALAILQTCSLGIPFIIVSGAIGEEAAAAAMRRGATDYLLKDRLTRLGAAVRQAVEARRLRESQRALQREMREREERFRALIERSWDVVMVFSAEGTILYSSPASIRILGFGSHELAGQSVWELTHPDDRETLRRQISDALHSIGRGVTALARLRHKNGSWRNLEGAFTNLLEEPGVRGIVVNFRDITERQETEKVLSQSQEHLNRAVRAGNVGLWDWDLQTNRVYFSPEWKRQIGYEEHEITDEFSEWQSRVHPDDLGEALRRVEAYLGGAGTAYEAEFRFRHKNGSYRHILAHGSKLTDGTGKPLRLLGSHVDVTERTQLQAQFLQAQKMESVGQLAGGIAHDFNNLLTVINGTADLAMLSLKPNDPLRADLQQIRSAGERAATLTGQLLAFSRKQIMKPGVLDLNAVVLEMQSLLERLIGEHIHLAFKPAESLGTVKTDPTLIEQVVMNLAVNARDAMPDGGSLTLETQNVELDAAYASTHPTVVPGPYVMLAVSDSGVGMDEATQSRIFEPFFTTKGPSRGTGLGLSTVYGIVKQSGGNIWVYSEPGQGTTFKVYLPRVDGLPSQQRPARVAMASRGTETILIVEDDASVRRLAARTLQSAGYTAIMAGNGAEALQLLEQHAGPVHLMLTDVIMPGMSGRDLAARAVSLYPQMNVIYMSGYTENTILRHDLLNDAKHFISKPYTMAELTRKVREVLDSPKPDTKDDA